MKKTILLSDIDGDFIYRYKDISELAEELKIRRITIGDNCNIGDCVYIGNSVTIGKGCEIQHGCEIGSYVEIGEYTIIGFDSVISKYITIGG